MMKTRLMAGVLLVFSSWALAGVEYRQFDTPEQEQSYKILTEELRCLVCQNQNIADSNADLAKDLRNQVYVMLQQGKSREQIAEFMTDRYGDFVLYNPPFKLKTGFLWMGPVVFFLIGIVVLWMLSRKKTTSEVASVTDQDLEQKKKRIRELLEQGEDQ
jgi:cytochrome c-type biogenesis protein CcmH